MSELITFSISNHIKKAYSLLEASIEKQSSQRKILRSKGMLRSTVVYAKDLVDEALQSNYNTKRDIRIALELKEQLNKLIKIIDTKI